MVCSKCSTQNDDNALYCPKCGCGTTDSTNQNTELKNNGSDDGLNRVPVENITFDYFCETYFNGDTDAALKQLAHEGYYKQFKYLKNLKEGNYIINNMSQENKDKYEAFYKEEYKRNPDIANRIVKAYTKLPFLNMDDDAVHEAKENPFRKKALIDLLICALCFAACVVVIVLGINEKNSSTTISIMGCGMTTVTTKLIFDIINFFRFKSVKKTIDEIEECNNGKSLDLENKFNDLD